MTKIYLAGKISVNDWRGSFLKDEFSLRNATPHTKLITNANHEYAGPFFLSCDHGCFHGESSHGMSDGCGCAFNSYDDKEDGYTKREILVYCLNWINQADIVFAWINSKDCYGTLAEIGYAYACNKKIWVVFSDELFKYPMGKTNEVPENHDMWFISKMAENVSISSNPLEKYVTWSLDDKM